MDEMTDEVRDAIAAMDAEEARADKYREANERTFTDMGIRAEDLPERKAKPKTQGDLGDATPWQGDRYSFTWLIGLSAVWAGPASLWLKSGKCRLCGHLAKLPENACCLNPECLRTGVDVKEGIAGKKHPKENYHDRPDCPWPKEKVRVVKKRVA